MAAIIEDARMETILDAGHLANLDNPGAFDDRVEHFLHERVEQ
jgi:pimeloyl-ACP methyl ester carboxylesterase